MAFLDTVKHFLGRSFGDFESGLKPAGLLAVAGSTLAGFGIGGGPIGALIGAGLGVLLAEPINTLATKLLSPSGSAGASEVKIPRIEPQVQATASESITVVVAQKQFILRLPKTELLKRPWERDADSFLSQLESDQLTLLDHPTDAQVSKDVLEQSIKHRNEALYSYLTTVRQYQSDFQQYHEQVRPDIVKVLGLDEASPLGMRLSPPPYGKSLDLNLPDDLDGAVRVHLKISDDAWNKLDSVTRLSRMEESISQRMADLSKQFSGFRKKAEELGSKLDFSLGNALYRLNPLVDSREKRFRHAVSVFMRSGNEPVFRAAVDELAGDEAQEGRYGRERAELVREMGAIVVEQRKLTVYWSKVQGTKKRWVEAAEDWLPYAQEFRAELQKYTGVLASGKGFHIVQELPFAVPADKGKEELAAVRKQKQELIEKMDRARTGVEKLSQKFDGVKDIGQLADIDIRTEIRCLPTSAAFLGDKDKDVERLVSKDMLLGELYVAARDYNEKLAAYKKNPTDVKSQSLLQSTHGLLLKKLREYLENAETMYNTGIKGLEKREQELVAESTKGTALEGTQGVAITLVDTRKDKIVRFELVGLKKNGKIQITGWRPVEEGDTTTAVRWFGKDIRDLAAGIEFDPKTFAGLEAILKRMETGGYQAADLVPPKVPDRKILQEAKDAVTFTIVDTLPKFPAGFSPFGGAESGAAQRGAASRASLLQ